MLQQTRVATAIPYYERFLARFPDFETLADAPESELLAHWAGLGYYYRARNLQKAAQSMRDAGYFPTNLDEIRSLPGIGDYTAAAIASICFDLPHAAVDGNVLRVVSRVFNDSGDISSGAGRKHLSTVANKLLDRDQPGTFNQALMELGAMICLPKKPQCLICPVSESCQARKAGRETELPVKTRIQKSVALQRKVFWVERQEQLLVWQRPSTDRFMPGFWELPEEAQFSRLPVGWAIGSFRHTITFHKYAVQVIQAVSPCTFTPECRWIPLSNLDTQPVSTVFRKARRVIEKCAGGAGTQLTAKL